MAKCNSARKVAYEGVPVVIANGKRDNILIDLISHPDTTLSTRFIPAAQPVSSIKKWIAHSGDFAKGSISLNANAVEAICGSSALSVLPIGVTAVEGEFEKDDIISIKDPEGHEIGVGRTSYDSEKARQVIGQHSKKPLIHYDYLYIK